jgi:hypothetical protein
VKCSKFSEKGGFLRRLIFIMKILVKKIVSNTLSKLQ